MVIRKIILGALALVLCGAIIGVAQIQIDTVKGEVLEDELLYIPSEKLLDHFTAGMSNVIADLLWIETIQYTVKEFHNPDRKFRWLEHMCNAVVSLDPYFVGAYTNGATFMSAIGADDKAVKLLKKGFVNNPDSHEIPHEMVKVYVLNRREEPEAPAVATHYLRMLAERHEHPEMYMTWARRIQEENSLDQEAKAIWQDVLQNSTDQFIREIAENNLRLLIVGDNVAVLNTAADHFAQANGRRAASLDELIQARIITALPNDPEQGEYFVDDAGIVQNMLLLEDMKTRTLMGMNPPSRVAADEHGRPPASIEEWSEWTGIELPRHPVPGQEWHFDPETGEFS